MVSQNNNKSIMLNLIESIRWVFSKYELFYIFILLYLLSKALEFMQNPFMNHLRKNKYEVNIINWEVAYIPSMVGGTRISKIDCTTFSVDI